MKIPGTDLCCGGCGQSCGCGGSAVPGGADGGVGSPFGPIPGGGGVGGGHDAAALPSVDGAEDALCSHYVDADSSTVAVACACPGHDKPSICGPIMDIDVAKIALMLLEVGLFERRQWLTPRNDDKGPEDKPIDPMLDLKQYSKRGFWRIQQTTQDNDEVCPDNCPRKGGEAENTYGCIILCGECVEGSVPGNILFGFATERVQTIANLKVGYGSKPAADRCAIDVGTEMANLHQGGWIARLALCEAIRRTVKVEGGCEMQKNGCGDCDPCTELGEYPPFHVEYGWFHNNIRYGKE